MKVIRFIFVLYVLFLAVFPCSDSRTSMDEQKGAITFIASEGHNHATGEQDACTPFCICSCCAAQVQLHSGTEISFTNLDHNTPVTSRYLEKPLLDKTASIWQPPRI
ncbi:MAG TPA: hypothetical protein PKJ63_01940 [Cyclobacteriaceae bacterium]|nr:hypothetical protein [Cyclobacteriaceae bacterium]